MLGPSGEITTVWRSLVDWARFNESTEWQEAWAEMNPYLTNLTLEIWDHRPLFPGLCAR